MNKLFYLLVIFLFLSSCSLDTKSGLWTKTEKLDSEKKNLEVKIFEENEIYERELNIDLKIKLRNDFKKNSFINNLSNNNGVVNFDGSIDKIKKFKFSKIDQFDNYQPELLITKNNNLIFFDDKGTVLNFSSDNELIWKNNYYSKREKKLKPILYFAANEKTLVVADSISKYYAININDGKLNWIKNNIAPFNSQIKIFKDKFFVVDFENILRCFSIKDGTELWNLKTEKSFTKSQKKLSLVIADNKLYFNNSIGDISAVDINNGSLLWQTPSQKSLIYEEAFSLQTSDLITDKKSIFFSNNKNDFFSLDIRNGIINWKQKINSNLRPTFVDQLVFTVSNEGFLIIIDSKNGNILRITDVFEQFKKKKRKKIKPVGFILGVNDIYLTTNHGRLIIIDIISGKIKSILKIDNELISRPFVLNQDLYIIKNNSIIKLN